MEDSGVIGLFLSFIYGAFNPYICINGGSLLNEVLTGFVKRERNESKILMHKHPHKKSFLANASSLVRLLGLSLLLLFVLASFTHDEDCVITWSPARKLTWKDYKGKPKPRFAAASTVYSLGRNIFEEKGKVHARIEAFFYCNDSWKKDDWISEDVLAHEQKHFDIVELYARKLRKQTKGLKYLDLKDAEAKIDSLYKILSKEMDVYQDKYDDESDGSMNGDGQRKWNEKIEAELKVLEPFSSVLVILATSGDQD